MPDVPPGVDPDLWAEFQALSDHIHELLRHRRQAKDGEGSAPPTYRVLLDVPAEALLLFTWLLRRRRLQQGGNDGPTGCTAANMETLGLENLARNVVQPWLSGMIDRDFHSDLHRLCAGADPRLKAKPEPIPKPVHAGDTDDTIPF